MKQLEVYFDYLCPYCYKGHQTLMKLLPRHPDVSIVWMPCEAHPRPEVSRIYSDVAIMGMFYLRDSGGHVDLYNELVYDAHFNQHQPIDNPDVLTALAVQCGANAEIFRTAITDGRYAHAVLQANIQAWNSKAWQAVPSYTMGERNIGSSDGVLVSVEALDHFLSQV